MKILLLVLLATCSLLALPLAAQTATTPQARRIAAAVRYLASDALQGRKTCSAGNDSAAAYIARELGRLRLAPRGDGGTFLEAWTVGNTSGTREAGVARCLTRNVLAALPGRGALAGQVVLLGAHFDHLGLGPYGSASGDSGAVHHGADDNASGTAALLELARLLTADRALSGAASRRTILLGWWSGEEEGALGSAYFANHMPLAPESALAYVNFDMVGRLRDRLLILGARTATEWPALLDSVNVSYRLNLRASGDGWGPSDQASFSAKRMPVLHFFTDLHEDYHRPSDVADRINADGIAEIASFGAELLRRLATRPGRLTYVDLPPPPPVAAASGRSRPALGTIPDMTDEPGGVRLSGVRSGSPADSVGLRAGDIVIGLGDSTIANLQDFQNALMSHVPGDRVELRFRRGDQMMRVMVTLGGRN